MIFEFKNLGSIKEAQIEMGNLTVICGKNNTGKTYLTYAVWGMFNYKTITKVNHVFDIANDNTVATLKYKGYVELNLTDLEYDFKNYVKRKIESHIEDISRVFDADKSLFLNTNISLIDFNIDYSPKWEGSNRYYRYVKEEKSNTLRIEINPEHNDIEDIMDNITMSELDRIFRVISFEYLVPRVKILTAQREAIHLFKYAISRYNGKMLNELKHNWQKKDLDYYSLPLEDNISDAISLSELENYKSFLYDSSFWHDLEKMLDIKYIQNNGGFNIVKNESIIPSFMASTSVRSLADLHFWLKHQAQKGDLLMIDEPELNLHPENQIKMARLFAKLVNVGIKVWITTHSDYIVKELNNLVMLGNVRDREAMLNRFKNEKGENEYAENDILKAEDLKAYIAYNLPDGSGATVRKIDVDKYGMVESTFDETINNINRVSRALAENVED